MFRQQPNVFEDVIVKATDENLTSENWEYMMDAWEKINESPENGPKNAVAALIKRLAHRNANVQLYTLELANAFSQNCGPKMHRELASRSFTDAMLRLAADRNTHPTVKAKILERMAEWSEMFSKEPDLGIMEGAYNKLKSQNPNIQAPSKPHKREITDIDRQKEEEELQMALAISLKDRPQAGQSSSSKAPQQSAGSNPVAQQSQAPASTAEATPHTTAATVSRVRALFDFVPTEKGELAFRKGDIIAVLESVYKDWWSGSLRGQTGIFPLNYVEKLTDPTQEEVMKEAQMEAEVFAEIKNVEKLLALLSTSNVESNVQENEEITTLYHQTLAIRPKLIELIGKYSQKKDDFVALNEKFIKARRDYENLLESSMSQGASHYGRPGQPPYNYGGDPYPPAGERFYTPAPQMNPSVSPSIQHGAFSPPPQQQKPSGLPYPGPRRTSNHFYAPPEGHESAPPPHGNNAPFYVVGQAPPGAQIPGRQQDPNQRPQGHQPPGPSGHPVDGQIQPQELATSIYDSPLDGRPPQNSGYPQPMGAPGGQERVPSPSQPPGQTPYGGYQAYLPPQQRPLSAGPNPPNPSVYTDTAANNSGPHAYPVLGSTSPSGAGGSAYQAYTAPNGGRPPQSYYTEQQYPPAPNHPAPAPPQSSGPGGAPGGAPHDYYKQNELFLPPGSRAQS
ncbi:uncharacterized protein LAJ45_01904 [Morchella importuna]|uniref:uncharacterized protein n=1 Tax=Morchella importuna TaxID=1174673 RepID=UPI001E8E176E|nr:uncharacterized protein LAJ45_01904 [Morchella importuna]KAH8154136.1 hypothetical protein LAJ45_01904 [Morchella importuna]